MSYMYTPLRYPGGKAKLAPFIKTVFEENGLCDAHYVEPYAGGAGIGLSLLFTEYSRHIYLNDISYPIYCLWDTILNNTDYLIRRISNVRVTPTTWKMQKRILKSPHEHTPSEVGFSLFFLNRTNRSGIVTGGMIGGNDQTGKWKIDARFGKHELIRRIEAIAAYRDRISIHNMDAMAFMQMVTRQLPRTSFIYMDPPYYVKGSRLYTDYYRHNDHERIAEYIQTAVTQPWIVTYDNIQEITLLYSGRRSITYDLNYSASSHRKGTELMLFCDSLRIPAGGISGRINRRRV
jgi:DNA adenine methylase